MDILCAKCGEPWDSYSVRHEMDRDEQTKFLSGQGCEACDYGESCPDCSGTGKEKSNPYDPHCEHCLGGRYLIVRQLYSASDPRLWQYGYLPHVREISNPNLIHEYKPRESREGLYRSAKAICPDCREEAHDCQVCNGSGKLRTLPDGDLLAAESEVEASDEDPFLILQRRRLI